MGACDWDVIRDIRKTIKIPMFANGGVHKWADVERCLEHTGVQGIMSAEALLENPALFAGGKIVCLDQLATEYIDLWEKYDKECPRYLKPHLFKILHKGLNEHTDLRDKLGNAKNPEECKQVVEQLRERRKEIPIENKFGWYERYQTYKPQNNGQVDTEKDQDADKLCKRLSHNNEDMKVELDSKDKVESISKQLKTS